MTPYPFPVTTIVPPACTVTSAISGLPTTRVAVRSGTGAILAWSNISLSSPTNANGTLNTAGFGYSPGNPGDIVVVRLIYQWPIIAAGIGFCAATACGLVNSSSNTNTLVATVAFRNEPYTPGT